jgi:catechol 2,3-dioxygenase-like lactoylglutathione lyase family enzyme
MINSSTTINVRKSMSRLQLALNVSNLDEAIEFYSKFFNTTPAKVRPGYANFAILEPPLKLVLIEGAGHGGSINHLGVEVESTKEVTDATSRLSAIGMAVDVEEGTTCCFAVQDKVWVDGPDSSHWEIYTVLADASVADGLSGEGQCCTTDRAHAEVSLGATCC